jgi:septum formation protein
MDRIVLASKSPRRREILERLGIPFVVQGVDIDEKAHHRRTVRSSVMNLSRAKAVESSLRYERGLILGVDTVVAFNGRILGKPATVQQARAFLRMLSGNRHEVFSGITIVDACSGVRRTSCSVSSVYFAPLDDAEIERYLEVGEWHDKAGGYAIQGWASLYVRRIEGSYCNIVGLPVEELYRLLKGFRYFSDHGIHEPLLKQG